MSKLTRIMVRAHLAVLKDRSGATAIEYGLIAAGIAVAIVGAVFAVGTELDAMFDDVVLCLQDGTTC